MVSINEERNIVKEIGKAIKSEKFKGFKNEKKRSYGGAYYIEKDDHVHTLRILGKSDYDNIGTQKPGVIPNSIVKLSHLEVLEIWYVNIPEIPLFISDLTKLKELVVKSVPIKTLPETIGKITSLKKINISTTYLQNLPESFGNLENLEDLSLGDCLLESLPASARNLSNLKKVYLAGKFKKIPSCIFNWTNCSELSLYKNPLAPEDKKLHAKAQTWGVRPPGTILGAGIVYLCRELYKRYIEDHPDEIIEFEENVNLTEAEPYFNEPEKFFEWQVMTLDSDSLMTLARAYEELEDFNRERMIWNRVLQLVPNLFNAQNRLFELELRLKPPEEAEQILTELLIRTHDVTSINYLKMLVDVKIKLEKYNDAVSLLQQYTSRIPKDPFAWYDLGTVYLELGNKEAAKNALGRCISLISSSDSHSRMISHKFNEEELHKLYNSL